MTRLSVNINDECAEALRRVKAARGIDTTEAIRRAISLLDYFDKAAPHARLYIRPSLVCRRCGNYEDTPGHFFGCGDDRSDCLQCGHRLTWHDPEEDGMCAQADCYCQNPEDAR